MKETMGNAADSAKKYYDEHARERVSAYATQAADIAKQAAAKAKETSKGAKVRVAFPTYTYILFLPLCQQKK